MKKLILLLSLVFLTTELVAQEKYGKTLNFGGGLSYSRYAPLPIPALNLNYEFDIAPNTTLGPYLSILHHNDYGYNYLGKKYKYSNTIVPVGVKSYYYFDGLFNWDKRFDVYAGLAVGFNIAFGRWENGYNGPVYNPTYNPFYAQLHAGGEYHFKDNLGVYVDLSTGLSTVGLAFHL
jgi:hypothetical protein|tara:strand:+ start:10576 stop:11106 length:531 start_codon:yes stop_codon:yes gene_type:complete